MRAYLDSDAIIYLIEQNPQFGHRVERWLLANPCDIVASELSRMECLVMPVRNNDAALIADFEDLFQTRLAELVGLTRPLFDLALRIRAQSSIKTPDALFLAAAVESGCDAFVTNDPQLAQFTGVRVELI